MHFDWWTLALQTINFAILVWLLHRFLYKPVRRVLEARQAEVDADYAKAAAADAEAKARMTALEAEHQDIDAERRKVLATAMAQGEKAAEARRDQAEHEAADMLASSRQTLAEEREAALAEARVLALDLGADFARRLLAEMPLQFRAEAWLERVEHYLAGMPAAERRGLGGHDSEGAGSLRVVTAADLPSETVETWTTRMRLALADRDLPITFETDPDLIAGVELHFPGSVLRFSWRSALATLRLEAASSPNHNGNTQR